ncbi:MAG: ExbD/TolR family protein [Sphingomonadaceae bacterium]
MHGHQARARRAPMAEINVTPLVDVMLVLLIIFMVTAPLLMAGVPVNLPENRAGALEQESEPVQISLDAAGRIFLGEEQVADGELPLRLETLARRATEEGGPRVYLRADRSLDYGQVMRVMGEIDRAGLRRVALVSTGEQR